MKYQKRYCISNEKKNKSIKLTFFFIYLSENNFFLYLLEIPNFRE